MIGILRFVCCAFGLVFTLLPAQAGDFESVDLSGTACCRSFDLTDHNGERRRLADFRGKVVVVTFGFTGCPDVCPTTLLRLNEVVRDLGPAASQVQVLFVTLDPERDSEEVLSRYVPYFNEHFLGLRGEMEVTRTVAKEFRVFYRKNKSSSGSGYTIDHTAGTYTFDRRGNIRLFTRYGSESLLGTDLRALLDSP